MAKPVYIFTNFNSYLKSFSPILVVGEQLKMLTRAGYEPVLIVSAGWEAPEGTIFADVKTERIYPADPSGDKVDEIFTNDVKQLYQDINEILPDDAVVITHDLIFLPDYVKHNVACRKVAEKRPSIKWLHWVHSATNPNQLIEERSMYGEKYVELLGSKFPNSVVVFPNEGDIPRVANNFNYEEDEVFCVPHSTDPTEGMDPLVQRLYDEKRLGNADALMVYPLRLDRGKAAEVNIRVTAGLKEAGLDPHVVFCDFQSTGGDKVTYREELKKLAEELGIEQNVTFLSEFDEAASMEIDHSVILDLFTLSNIFILPSKSETYSLVAQEAMLKGNLVILNHHFTPMRTIYGNLALYRHFDANVSSAGDNGETTVNYNDGIQNYMNGLAQEIKYYLVHNRILAGKTWVRTKRNPDAVFEHHLEPLLYRGDDELPAV